mgnify:CR=1 FL=1
MIKGPFCKMNKISLTGLNYSFMPRAVPLFPYANQNHQPLRIGRTPYFNGGLLVAGQYRRSGNIALSVHSEKTGQFIFTASIDIPHALHKANDRHIWLCAFGINEGVPEAMEKAGHVRLTGIRHEFTAIGGYAVLALIKPHLAEMIKTQTQRKN